jgi:hypothetical protein
MNVNFTDEDKKKFGIPLGVICYDVEKDELNLLFTEPVPPEEYIAILKKFIDFKKSFVIFRG